MTPAKHSPREADLRPYQTHFLFSAMSEITPQALTHLLRDLPSIINYGKEDEDRCEVLHESPPRRLKGDLLAWLTFRREVPVAWAVTAAALRDVEHHVVILLAHKALLSLVTSDPTLGARVPSRAAEGTRWAQLHRAPSRRIESALVRGVTKTLWLSGIHRSVATKADSKMLVGPDVEASLDALGDQTYHYTSTRCEGPQGALAASFVGVTPRLAKVWVGPSTNWEVFLANGERLLSAVDLATGKGGAPYPILAREHSDLKNVRDAFDISLAPPELLYEQDAAFVGLLEDLLQRSKLSVRPDKGPNCFVDATIAGKQHQLKITLEADGPQVRHRVTLIKTEDQDAADALIGVMARADVMKIFFESLHTYSTGQLYQVKTRPIPFGLTTGVFAGFDVTREKPEGPLDSHGRPSVDLSRIGAKNEISLFTWVWKRFKKGWLWCDDGSGEIADFIHLNPVDSMLSLIHVKAAGSDKATRGISVAAYEVVCSQALKNLRYTERQELESPLKKKLQTAASLVRGWRDGKPLAVGTKQFWAALEKPRYSELKHKVIIVQPHVRQASLPDDLSKDTNEVRRAKLLYTLLHAVKADINRYGAEFEVIADR